MLRNRIFTWFQSTSPQRGESNFMVEEPGRHHFYQVVTVNISYWNHAWPGLLLWEEHSITSVILWPESNPEETSGKFKLREILQSNWTHLRNIKVMKAYHRLKNIPDWRRLKRHDKQCSVWFWSGSFRYKKYCCISWWNWNVICGPKGRSVSKRISWFC